MTPVVGYGTGLAQRLSRETSTLENNNHAWQVMFGYGGPQEAMRMVQLGPIPGEFPDVAVRQVLLDKHATSDASLDSARSRRPAASGDRCLLCRIAFGAEYDDPGLGRLVIQRNRRNRYYCNICDLFIRACPGQATLMLPVLVVDVTRSKDIRKRVGLSRYSTLLAQFHRDVSATIQKQMGFILNTVGDAIIAVWPSGFVPEEVRERFGWDPRNPARIPAMYAIRAAESVARGSPLEFEGDRLPCRGGLDTTEMIVFSVVSDGAVAGLAATEDDLPEVGQPLIDDDGNLLLELAGGPVPGSESEFQTGPAATDLAGEAVEVASALASDDDVPAGTCLVTRRTDVIAGTPNARVAYQASAVTQEPTRPVGIS